VNRAGTLTCWALVALLAWPWAPASERAAVDGAPSAESAADPFGRWLGPVAALAASFEWVRWTTALGRGELARAHTHAARALALDPASPEGWLTLAQHLVFDRSAAVMEPDRGRRTAFARAGLDVLRRGEARSRDAAGLALIGGDLAVFLAERAGAALPSQGADWIGAAPEPELAVHDLDWPGGPSALLDEAKACYTRARELGHPDAAERLERLRTIR
jgi:hypothetical protein